MFHRKNWTLHNVLATFQIEGVLTLHRELPETNISPNSLMDFLIFWEGEFAGNSHIFFLGLLTALFSGCGLCGDVNISETVEVPQGIEPDDGNIAICKRRGIWRRGRGAINGWLGVATEELVKGLRLELCMEAKWRSELLSVKLWRNGGFWNEEEETKGMHKVEA